MSRSSHQRQQQQLLAQQQQQMADNDAAAAAAEMFDMFCSATTMRQILGLHRNMCDTVGLRPAPINEFYPKLKAKIHSWKAQALWKKFDTRAAHRAYSKGNACTGTRVLVIGSGPCGLRTAIEAQLLGAKVVVLEKRDRISRNNVLHLWPFVITDLRNLGAKKFYGKFCSASIDHVSIRQLQCILLKVALLLGVEIHEGVSFERTIEPSEGCGWRAAITPEDHAVSHYEFDVLIGADGKRNTLEGFRRKEFRGKLAIAITANFINKKTEAEAKAEEISGVAFIFNQTFFKELYHTTGIDLENIVYYKDETHYFVMTAKKHSLIDKGVILQDFADPAELLAPPNVNTDKLLDYAREAAEFSTKYQMPNLEFAVNHYGKPDVAMFDFTSMFAAESSCRVIVRKNYRLMQCLVGDSLLEPFWPTGSGCARGFLSSMDAAYAIKLWSNPKNSILGVVAQRESIYRLLAQTTPENLQRDIGSYTVDPATRYPNLNRTSVNVWQVKHLIDCDDKSVLEQTFMDTNALQASQADTPVRRKRRTGDTLPLSAVLLRWIKAQLHSYEFTQSLNEVSDCFTNGRVLCALINRYRPDLVDFSTVKDLPPAECNDLAFKILDKELKISRVMTGKDSIELEKVDSKIWLNYLEQICEVFRGEIPHVKHPKLDVSELREKNRNNAPDFSKLLQLTSRKAAKSPMQDVADMPQHVVQRRSVLDEEKVKRQRKHEPGQAQLDTPRRAKKRRSAEKTANIEERQQRLKEIEANRQDRQSKRRMQRFQQTQNFYKSLHMLQVNTLLRESDESSPFEDYSIYMYRQQAPIFNDRVKELERKLLYPDRERGISSAMPRGADEQFSDRIKSMEQRITSRNAGGTDKKPKDLMRAIGKIDSTDWNVREIEKKIEQSKKTETGGKGREKVPKWSKEQFVARQSKMSKPTRQDSGEEKFKEIDQTLKNLDKQLKEGNVLEVGERGKNKVASIAGQFVKKDDTSEEKNPPPLAKSNSKVALAFKKQAASEKCHFCKQTVYLMEKISTEGLILHRSCLKCHHCHTNLRLGGYAFDRDDPEGRFYCTQHFRLPAKAIRPMVRKPGQRKSTAHGSHTPAGLDPKTPEKPRGIAENVVQLDLLDRGQTPERIEFENTDAMSDGEPSEEHIIDENEWSGRNFLQPSADSESDLSSSSDESDDDSASDIFEEANGSPIAQQTLQLANDWIGKQHYSNVNTDDSDNDSYDTSEELNDDGKDDTEGEEIKKAREMRREEVRLLPLPTNLPTDTETEKQSEQVVGPQDGVTRQKIDDVSIERSIGDADKISIASEKSSRPPSKTDIEKIEQSSDRRFSADVDAISEKLYRLNNLMKMNKDIESMAKENLVKSDILKKLTLKEKWLLDNSVSSSSAPSLGFPTPQVAKKIPEEVVVLGDQKIEDVEKPKEVAKEPEKPVESVTSGDDDRGDGLQVKPVNNEEKPPEPEQVPTNLSLEDHKENVPKLSSDKMEIEGILDIVKMMDTSYIEQSKEPLPTPQSSPKAKIKSDDKDVGKMLYEAEHKNDNRLSDALRQIEATNFAGTMDTIKSQIVAPTISHQGSLDISKYFPNAKQEKQSSGASNKNQKTLKDVDLTKYFPQSPVPQRKVSVTSVADKLKKSQTEATVAEAPKAPPRRQKSMASGTDKSFSMHEHLLDGAIDLQKAPVVKPVAKKVGIKIVKKIVPKGTKAKKAAAVASSKKPQDEADRILDEILKSGQEVRSPSVEYQKLFTEEKSPSEDISERIEKILEETGFDLGLPPKPKKKLLKTKSLGEEEFRRTQDKMVSKEDGDRPVGVQQILQRFESMSSIKSDGSAGVLRKTNLSSTCSSLNKSRDSLQSKESLQSEPICDLEKTMEYLKSEWRTEATNFLQKKRTSFYAKREEKPEIEEERKPAQTQWKNTKYGKFFGLKEKSPEKRKSPTKSIAKRKSPAKVLKKSPREEILKHRKKVESVSSRRASFEEKIKAEEERLKAEEAVKTNGSRKASLNGEEVSAKARESPTRSKIPISQNRKETQNSGELNRNVMDTAQKILNRRGSESGGLADVLKPPVVKGVRGLQGEKPKAENNSKEQIRKGSQTEDALKAVLGLVRRASQSSLIENGEEGAKKTGKTNEISSRRGSAAENLPSPRREHSTSGSQSRKEPQSGLTSPVIQSRRGSEMQAKRTPPADSSRKNSLTETITKNSPMPASRRSSNISEAIDQTITTGDITDVDEIFDEIVNELGNDEGIRPGLVEEVELIAIAPELADDGAVEEQPESQTIAEQFERIAKRSRSSSARKAAGSRASSEDSIEKLFSQFTDDMLVDVEFDSNDEVVAITPRAVLVQDDDNAEDEDEEEEKPITIEQARLKFEPLFPRQAERLAKSTSSSMSMSPVRADSRTKKIVEKMNPSNMTPSVQDMLQKIIPREEKTQHDRVPVAFPRHFYESEEESSVSPRSGAQTPEKVSAKGDHLEVVYELAWPARKRSRSPVPESARPPVKPVVSEPNTSRRGSTETCPTKAAVEQPNDTPLALPRNVGEPEHNGQIDDGEPDKENHLGVVYELAWPNRKRSRSPVPESARPPIKPPISREGSMLPSSRRGSKDLLENAGSGIEIPRDSPEIPVVLPRLIPTESDAQVSDNETKGEHLEVVYELAWPTRKRSRSPVPESVRPPVKPPVSRETSALPSSRRGSKDSIGNSDSCLKPDNEVFLSEASPSEVPVVLPRVTEPQTKLENSEAEKPSSTSENLEVVYELAWPARKRSRTPVPESVRPPIKPPVSRENSAHPPSRRGSNDSSENLKSLKTDQTGAEISKTEIQSALRKPLDQIPLALPRIVADSEEGHLKFPSNGDHIEVVYELAWPRRKRSRSPLPESARPPIKPVSRESSQHPSSRRGSNNSIENLELLVNPLEMESILQASKSANNSRRGSRASIKEENPNIQSISPAFLPTPPRRGSRTSVDSLEVPASRRGSKVTLQGDEAIISPVVIPSPRKGSKSSPELEVSTKNSVDRASTSVLQQSTQNDLVEMGSPSKDHKPKAPSRLASSKGSPTSDRSVKSSPSPEQGSRSSDEVKPKASSPKKIESAPPPIDKTVELNKNEKLSSPLTAREKFFAQRMKHDDSPDWDMSKIQSSTEKLADKDHVDHEPSREYKDLLRSKLESPTLGVSSRSHSQSKEKSLEWDMEQLPRSPMPRRKYVDMLLHRGEKEESPKPTNIPLPTPPPAPVKVAQNIPSKRLEEWEIVEQLERERRLALIKRDENYTQHVQDAPPESSPQAKGSSWQPPTTLNRIVSLEEPQSSKLIEYIKQHTLGEPAKQRDSSPKALPPSKKASHEPLERQVEALLRSKDSQSPKSVPKHRQAQKPNSNEATYEDFARFTRKSAERQVEEDPDEHDHRPSSYRQKSPESTTGTYSPTSSLSKSIEHLAPSRPHRHKTTLTTSVPEDRVDRETKYLMDRSKHLRNMKRDFMEEKIAGNNPYLRKAMEVQKYSRDDDEDEVDYALESYRPKNHHTTPRFPTSTSMTGRRRREPRYTDYTPSTDYIRRPYSPHYSTASTTSSVGSRHFVDHFKRSPPHYKGRESSKDSCVLS